MAPIRGWGRKGKRLPGFAPDGRWPTLRIDALTEPCVVGGPINGTIFRGYVEQFLVPTLRPGDIVVLDNLGSHRSSAIRTAHKSQPAGWRCEMKAVNVYWMGLWTIARIEAKGD